MSIQPATRGGLFWRKRPMDLHGDALGLPFYRPGSSSDA